ALGLGHAQPLTESTDLMGYGWHWSNGIVPTLSGCDLAGIAVVFAWALQGVDPDPPTQPSVACCAPPGRAAERLPRDRHPPPDRRRPWAMSGHEVGDSKGQQRCPADSCALCFDQR